MPPKTFYTAAEIQARLESDDITLIDVRRASEFGADHIPGAASLPEAFDAQAVATEHGLRAMVSDFVPLLRGAGVEHGRTIVVYEDGLHAGYGASCRSCFLLEFLGHEDVGILVGGLSGWRRAGFGTTAEPSLIAPSSYAPRLRRETLATLADVVAALDDPGVKLLDIRDGEEWRGVRSSPESGRRAPRKGRIPGARWVEWRQFMTTGPGIPRFKSAAEIRSICAQVGLDVEDDIVIYCFEGACASNTYVAMKSAGFKRLRNYYGSWDEWSRHPELPIDGTVLVKTPALSGFLDGCST